MRNARQTSIGGMRQIVSDLTGDMHCPPKTPSSGDVLLDQQFKIVGSSRLKGLVDSCEPGSSFADLLDHKDWQKFLDFATASAGESLPPCMRVTLKSKHAEVGVDLFHVALPMYGKGNHHLLAIKEDPESRCVTSTEVPVAEPPLPRQEPGNGNFSGRASTTSSKNEAMDLCNELEEVTLLVNSQFEAGTPLSKCGSQSIALKNWVASRSDSWWAITPLGFLHPCIQHSKSHGFIARFEFSLPLN